MIKVLLKFCKNGKHYKRNEVASFSEYDEKLLVQSKYAKYVKNK